METLVNLYFKYFQPEQRIFLAFLLSLIFNFYLTPVIIRVAKSKRIFDQPDQRKSHSRAVPTLGGIGMYVSIVVVSLSLINVCGVSNMELSTSFTALPAVIAGITVLFFIGLKDDLINIRAWKKLAAEIVAVIILVVIGNLRLSSFQGMFHIFDLRYLTSMGVSAIIGIAIINAFNLIDGIDGLASSIAILASFIFGLFFALSNDWEYAIFCAIIIGTMIPFFLYNVFGKTNKIFMGDTGSLILGFLMTVLVFRFNELNVRYQLFPHFTAAPAFSFAVLILPVFDTIRVMAIRLYRHQGIFTADRRHIHHILLDLGLTHLQSTALLIAYNLAIIAFAYFFNFLGNSNLLFVILAICIVTTSIAVQMRRKKSSTKKDR